MAAMAYKWFLLCGLWFTTFLPAPTHAGPAPVKTGIPAYHPFYIAVTEISHNAAEKSLEISCRLFAEDLEETVKKNYHTPVDISQAKDKANLDKFIPDYFRKHLALTVNGKAVVLNYVGFEKDKESVYCYFQVDGVAGVKKLDVENSLLYDFNQDQINIIHAVVQGKRQSTKLNNPARQASFSF